MSILYTELEPETRESEPLILMSLVLKLGEAGPIWVVSLSVLTIGVLSIAILISSLAKLLEAL